MIKTTIVDSEPAADDSDLLATIPEEIRLNGMPDIIYYIVIKEVKWLYETIVAQLGVIDKLNNIMRFNYGTIISWT